ncbi:hypothetical protein EA187_19245 [Lujinxingia sediminis]|uniref:Uncharacterized protein n=1 Tax=Lujinxingia sediminis TaxID=2480984 RepID=A0ABY0CP58_9DELT|nr:hypothetical protein [Lujinxingia sediminis]RVU41038.1 hypothetical protein EA187_19245 [Lujinxingia sediminis]
MSKDPYDIFANYDYRQTEEYKRHERAMEELDAMTPEEQRQTLIDAGILNEDGELVERYGGTAPNPED